MLPILISEKADVLIIIKFLIIKIIIGMLCGVLIDFILGKKKNYKKDKIKDFCEEHHCNCSHSIIKSAIKHTVSITLFLLAITFILNLGFHYLGYDKISKLFLKDNLFGSFISSLIGLIPNCASSVMLTKLYLEGVISFYSCLAGLLTSSGVALLLLFKVNENKKENLKILLTVYLIGALSGFIMELVCSLF